eukprot:530197-Rhodomonas_salina.1
MRCVLPFLEATLPMIASVLPVWDFGGPASVFGSNADSDVGGARTVPASLPSVRQSGEQRKQGVKEARGEGGKEAVSYTHLRAHETEADL